MIVLQDIAEAFDNAAEIVVYTDGSSCVYGAGDPRYDGILCIWNDMICGARPMPAYGVSLHSLTLEEMKSGKWVEFIFSQIYEYNGMPFEKLLVKVESGFHGFNLIRYNSACGYDGRCFYLDLVTKDMGILDRYLTDN